MPKALVTGLGGFVGPYLQTVLASKGFTVVGLDRSCKSDNQIRQADLLDAEQVNKIINEEKPAVVAHLAGFSSVKASWQSPEKAMSVNVEGTRNLLQAIEKAGIAPKVLLVSSAEVYGPPTSLPIKEDHQLNPQNPYARSRVAQEKLIHEFDLPIVITRSFNHTGPGQQEIAVVSSFAKQIAQIEKGKQMPLLTVGNLEVKRDISDVRDVVIAYADLMEKGRPGEIYNVCSGQSYTIKYILEKLISYSDKEIQYQVDKSLFRPNDIPVLWGDNSKIRSAIDWQPTIPIERTLKDILKYWRQKQ
ncbi:MAG: GDP-mannose 4,6-dehydratase [Patescibacteria group bacterium]